MSTIPEHTLFVPDCVQDFHVPDVVNVERLLQANHCTKKRKWDASKVKSRLLIRISVKMRIRIRINNGVIRNTAANNILLTHLKLREKCRNPWQCFGSGSGFYQVSGSVSGSRRAKMTHKNWKILRNFMFWSSACFFFWGLKASSVDWTSFMKA